MTDNTGLKEEILKKHEYDVHYYGGGRKNILEAMEEYAQAYHLARLEAMTDEVMVAEMGESAEQQRITHNYQYGAYKLGFRSCYEWINKKLSQ